MAAYSNRWQKYLGSKPLETTRLVRQKTQSDIVVSSGSRSAITEPEDDMGEYKLQVAVLEQKRENKRLNIDLEAVKQECQAQKERVKELEKQITNLCQNGTKLNDDTGQEFLVISKTKYEEKTNKLKEVQRLWMFSQKELVNAKETNEVQSDKIKKFEAVAKENESQYQKLQKSIEECKTSEIRLIKELSEAEKRHSKTEMMLNKKITEKENKLEEKRMEIENLMNKCDERITEIINENKAKVAEMTIEIEKRSAELKECSTVIANIAKERDEQISIIAEKDADIQACNNLKHHLSETQKQLTDREADSEALQHDYEELRATHEEFVEDYQSQLEELREEIEIRDAENDMLKEKVDRLIVRVKKAERKPTWK